MTKERASYIFLHLLHEPQIRILSKSPPSETNRHSMIERICQEVSDQTQGPGQRPSGGLVPICEQSFHREE